jgi:hypothetical protein
MSSSEIKECSDQSTMIEPGFLPDEPKQSKFYSRIRLALLITSVAILILGTGASMTFGLLGFQAVTALGESTVVAFTAGKLCSSVGSLLGGTLLGTHLLWVRAILGRGL